MITYEIFIICFIFLHGSVSDNIDNIKESMTRLRNKIGALHKVITFFYKIRL